MTLFNTINNQNIWSLWNEVREYQFDDYEEFLEKYGPVSNPEAYDKLSKVLWLFTEMGVLVHRGYVSMIDVLSLMALTPVMAWEKFGPVIEGFRGKRYSRRGHASFEWLAKSMIDGVINQGEVIPFFEEFHNAIPDVSISDYRTFLKEHPELTP